MKPDLHVARAHVHTREDVLRQRFGKPLYSTEIARGAAFVLSPQPMAGPPMVTVRLDRPDHQRLMELLIFLEHASAVSERTQTMARELRAIVERAGAHG